MFCREAKWVLSFIVLKSINNLPDFLQGNRVNRNCLLGRNSLYEKLIKRDLRFIVGVIVWAI